MSYAMDYESQAALQKNVTHVCDEFQQMAQDAGIRLKFSVAAIEDGLSVKIAKGWLGGGKLLIESDGLPNGAFDVRYTGGRLGQAWPFGAQLPDELETNLSKFFCYSILAPEEYKTLRSSLRVNSSSVSRVSHALP